MAKVDQSGGVSYSKFEETWAPTVNLAFMEIGDRKVLHQLWQSNIGRTRWRPIVEIDPNSADNE